MPNVQPTAAVRTPLFASRPPGPPGAPLLGHTLPYIRAPLPFLLAAGSDHGPVTFLRFGLDTVYLFNEPELIEQLLLGHARDCTKDKYTRKLQPVTGQGLLTSEGELWQRQRKLAAPPLAPKRIANYAQTMSHAAEQACARVVDGEVRDIHADFTALTLSVAGQTLLGADTSREAAIIEHTVEVFMQYYERQLYTAEGVLPPWFPTPARRRMHAEVERLDAAVATLIARCRTEGAGEDHVLARLLRARDEQGEAMSEKQLRDEVLTMLLAGHETSAVTLTFALYLLAGHPEVCARLRDEIDAASADDRSGPGVAALSYLNAVIRETLRLYPPAYSIGREVIHEFELGGYRIPRGTQASFSPYALHRQPRWFPDPERFSPERWLDPDAPAVPKFAYLPFGAGPRVCIGSHFAMLEIAITLAAFVRHFELARLPDFELTLRPVVTLRPATRVPLRFSRRTV